MIGSSSSAAINASVVVVMALGLGLTERTTASCRGQPLGGHAQAVPLAASRRQAPAPRAERRRAGAACLTAAGGACSQVRQ